VYIVYLRVGVCVCAYVCIHMYVLRMHILGGCQQGESSRRQEAICLLTSNYIYIMLFIFACVVCVYKDGRMVRGGRMSSTRGAVRPFLLPACADKGLWGGRLWHER